MAAADTGMDGEDTGAPEEEPDPRRNYLVILVDDVGVDKISSYAVDYPAEVASFRPETPTIDSISVAGIRFTRAWANPSCAPSRASLQTGVHPFRHGAGNGVDLHEAGIDPEAFELLGEVFSAAGYDTAFIGKWAIGSEDADGNVGFPLADPTLVQIHPARSGFSFFDGSYEGMSEHSDYTSWFRSTWADETWSGTTAIETGRSTDVLTDSAAAWIASREAPWLAVLAYHAPHANTLPNGSPEWHYADADATCYRTPALACLATETCADETLAVYQALLECVDVRLETLLAGMDPAALDRTTLVFLGDNGTPYRAAEGTFGRVRQGKSTVHETGLRVPLLVADGATWRTGAAGEIGTPGRTSTATVQIADLHATLVARGLGQVSTAVDSRSFAACWTDPGPDCGFGDPVGYGEEFEIKPNGALAMGLAAVRQGDAKSTFRYDNTPGCLRQETFNLVSDPWEQHPLSNRKSTGTALRGEMKALHQGTGSWAENLPFCP